MTEEICITYLADRPDLIPELATWFTRLWNHLSPRTTVEDRIRRLQAHVRRDGIPITFIALDRGRLVGSASLVAHDMDTFPERSPWLACVFVHPDWRHRGIGRRLVRRTMDEARRIRVPTLYLFTEDREAFYRHLGWEPLERLIYRGHPVVTMRADLTSTF